MPTSDLNKPSDFFLLDCHFIGMMCMLILKPLRDLCLSLFQSSAGKRLQVCWTSVFYNLMADEQIKPEGAIITCNQHEKLQQR